MSPGRTMMRVYATLKRQILAGAFAPGERLDPGRLAAGLGASRTPVRDALHRLSGERIVETWDDEGFRYPIVSEPAIRDLYDWFGDAMRIILQAIARKGIAIREPSGPWPDEYGNAVALCFLTIARHSPNLEHEIVVAGLNDRCARLRLVEAQVLDHAVQDLVDIKAALLAGDVLEIESVINLFHPRRIDAVSDIAAALRRKGRMEP